MALPHRHGSDESDRDEVEAERRRIQRQKNLGAIELLDRLMNASDEEAEDQRETLAALRHILHETDPMAEAQPVQAFPGGPIFSDDDLTEEEILAEQARRLDVLVETLMNVSEEEAQEQDETWEYLRRVLNEDRLSERRRVP